MEDICTGVHVIAKNKVSRIFTCGASGNPIDARAAAAYEDSLPSHPQQSKHRSSGNRYCVFIDDLLLLRLGLTFGQRYLRGHIMEQTVLALHFVATMRTFRKTKKFRPVY